MRGTNKYTCSLECSVINGFQEEEENAFEIQRRGSLPIGRKSTWSLCWRLSLKRPERAGGSGVWETDHAGQRKEH